MQAQLDKMFKATGHKNAYFPLFIPLSYLEKEAEHVAGFAKECAVVTHHRLEVNAEASSFPTGKLSEPLVVRPTSETIIGAAYAKWVQVVPRPPAPSQPMGQRRPLGNAARASSSAPPNFFGRRATPPTRPRPTRSTRRGECSTSTRPSRAIISPSPSSRAARGASERFPGAVDTLCIEAMVQDRKAVQAGTSHFLGQNFAKASGIQYLSGLAKKEYAWTTSWGVSTRLIGTLIMAHADDDGLVLPPRVAPTQVVIIPIIPKEEQHKEILKACGALAQQIEAEQFHKEGIRVEVDQRDIQGGTKSWEWIKKGVPIRVEIGPRDLEAGTVFVGRRDKGPKEKQSYPREGFACQVPALLQAIQDGIYERALAFRRENTRVIESKDEFYAFFTPKNADKPEIHGGFALAHWNGSPEIEAKIKEDLKVTIRCIPFEEMPQPGACIFTGEKSTQRVVFCEVLLRNETAWTLSKSGWWGPWGLPA